MLNSVYTQFFLLLILINSLIFFRLKICKKFNLFDFPDKKRKLQTYPIPTFNGFFLIFGLFILLIFELYISSEVKFNYSFVLFVISIVFYFVGYIDDKKNLSPLSKTLILIFILLIILPLYKNVILNFLEFKNLIKFTVILNQAAPFVTVFFIYIFYNLFNFIDGENGIAISTAIFFLIILYIFRSTISLSELGFLIILFSCLIINIKNLSYLGNSGSGFLSVYIALQYIHDYNINKTLLCDEIFVIFLIPGLDMIRLVIQRLKNNNSPFKGDRNHLHHLLRKITKRKYIFLIYFIILILPFLTTLILENMLFVILINSLLYFYLIKFLNKKLF